MTYDVVTFDTQTVISNGYHFDGGLLGKLCVLRHDTVEVIVSDIVISEILTNLSSKTLGIMDKLANEIRKALDYGIISDTESGQLPDRDQAPFIAQRRLNEYLNRLNAETLTASGVRVEDVMRLYFSVSPPFSSGEKKAEFPDAVTLLSIENYAKEKNKKVLAISGDKDWKLFADKSAFIDVVDTISEALELLNSQSSVARVIAGKILDEIDSSERFGLRYVLIKKLEAQMSSMYISAEASSYYGVESNFMEIELRDISFVDVSNFKLVNSNADFTSIDVEVELEMEINATAYFSFFANDSTDGAEMNVGSAKKALEKSINANVIITITVDQGDGGIDFVDIVKYPSTIDFGQVEPDYTNDYYDPEDEGADDSSRDFVNW